MAGPLDFLSNITPEQNQALLAAGSQILARSAPGRQPFSFGQAMGVGGLAFQDSMAEQQARAQHMRQGAQLEQMRGLQIEGMESDLEAQKLARQRAQEYQILVKSYQLTRGAGQQPTAAPQDRSGAAMFSSLMNGSAPAAGAPGEQQALTTLGAQPRDRNALVQDRLQFAQYLRDNGYQSEAQAAEDAALKLQPKVKEWQKVTAGGMTMYAPYFEDGTHGQPVPLRVAQALERVNLGGTTALIDPMTGETVRSLTNSVDPNTRANNAVTMRGQDLQDAQAREGFDRADARAERANPANKPLPLGALKMQDDGLEKLTTATGINTQLSAIRGQIKDGTLSFGPVSNLMNQGLNAAGISTDGSRAFANFRVTLEKLRNDSLRLNTGVQTDGDAQREWNALFQNINDTKWVAQRLEAIESLNARAAELQKLRIDGVRGNYGHAPLDYSAYEQPSPASYSGGAKFLGFE